MAELDSNATTTTNLTGTVKNVTTDNGIIDSINTDQNVTKWSFDDADENLGYYQDHAEIHSALKVLGQRVCGLGWTTSLARMKETLDNITGYGKDCFDSIIQLMFVESKIYGDSFAEIIRNDKGNLVNLKKLNTRDMNIYGKNGIISYYEINHGKNKPIRKEPFEILHIQNDRVGDSIHGTSIMPVLKRILDAKKEAFEDERKIRHRELALGVLEVDADNDSEFAKTKTEYQNAINKGEVLMLVKGKAELKDNPNRPRDRIEWLQYLDNLFYQVIGTPKVLVTSEGFTESGGKAGLISFEPTEIAAKLLLEKQMWLQLAIRITFTRSPSILNNAQSDESKNTGQTGIQNNETSVSASRTE